MQMLKLRIVTLSGYSVTESALSPDFPHSGMSPSMRKPVFRVSYQVKHKPDCTITEDGLRLEFHIYEVDRVYYLCCLKKGADQLHDYLTADLCLCFHSMQKASHLMTLLK